MVASGCAAFIDSIHFRRENIMLKKFLLGVAAFVATMGIAFAEIDINKADQAALDGIKGIGPATSKAILEERRKGEFKDWSDLASRIKGIGDKKAAALSEAGLTVNGQHYAGGAAQAKHERKDKAPAVPAKSDPAVASAKK